MAERAEHRVVRDPTDADDARAAAEGLVARRDLYQMRRPLPVPDDRRGSAPAVSTRAFRPGVDDEVWLGVNNRAFRWHPEQGDWTQADLASRLVEPWFDPEGFRLYEEEGRLVGFCWTKVHADHEPPLGEIFVIAVDPGVHGRGLGRDLTLVGLDWLHARGLTVGMLYVDTTNLAAVRLYENLGFTVHHRDRLYR
ncbi:hypothetical protein BH24ACT3_BH24ACT3_18770 [soil metagenome]